MCKVLIVDDDPVSVYLYKILLESGAKHEVIVSTTGLDAVELMKSEKPNVVMLDIMLPAKSGFDIYNEIQSEKEGDLRTIPVLFITAGFSQKEITDKTGVSIDYCLMKPIDFRCLISKIDSIIENSKKEIVENG